MLIIDAVYVDVRVSSKVSRDGLVPSRAEVVHACGVWVSLGLGAI